MTTASWQEPAGLAAVAHRDLNCPRSVVAAAVPALNVFKLGGWRSVVPPLYRSVPGRRGAYLSNLVSIGGSVPSGRGRLRRSGPPRPGTDRPGTARPMQAMRGPAGLRRGQALPSDMRPTTLYDEEPAYLSLGRRLS
jgi:hypothetical protein